MQRFSSGERLCNLEEGSPGSGTYTRHGYIFSSLAGCLTKSSENGAVKGAASHFLLLCFSFRLLLISRSIGKGTADASLGPQQNSWSPSFFQLRSPLLGTSPPQARCGPA